MKFYIADMHLGHENVLRFDNRPFENIEEMDRALIENWNKKVRDEDEVYIIGDFCYRSKHSPSWYLERLKGTKYLIQGNHDGNLLKDEAAMQHIKMAEKMHFVMDEGERIVLCHFPLAEWNGYYKGAWHIYGHIHNRQDETFEFMRQKPRALNAGCMINYYVPVTFKELIANNKIWYSEVKL